MPAAGEKQAVDRLAPDHPAQLGVARGITEALVESDLPVEAEHDRVAIAAVWVSRDANDADAVYRNNHQATRLAVRRALSTESERGTLARYASRPLNSYCQPKDRRSQASASSSSSSPARD